jgi:alkylation response protein AidB-like acyl-CoA dehydrogenase
MPIGITDEHEALRQSARRFLESRCPPSVPRALLDADEADPSELPPFWDELVELGWTTLATDGGFGALAVVVEELGRACAPGPFVTTALAAALLGGLDEPAEPWTVALDVRPGAPLLSGAVARKALVALGGDRWAIADLTGATRHAVPSVDATRPMARVDIDPARATPVDGLTTRRVRDVAAVLFAAEAAGIAGWCLETASSYAKVREQFGRPIGQFQAVKHRCADMLIAVERAVGTAWDAANAADSDEAGSQLPLAAAIAATTATEAATTCAKDCVQLLGGIGFTWEHDAHVYLKRALALRQLLTPDHRTAARLALAGARRTRTVDLGVEADAIRTAIAHAADELKQLDRDARRKRMADDGWLVPHWPRPWGRDAGPLEQLVIDEEFTRAQVARPNLAVGAWAAPTIVAHGTPEQQERWVGPTLRGEIAWCQLFSEPGAGSDLASLTTKATRTDGGWLLSGQKVWTSLARDADWGICLARTNPNAPKHLGITYFVVDMQAEGIDIRPLRELTGMAMFNEVFLSDVFVPDDAVIGDVDGGWALARTTLANERVAMAGGSSFGGGVEALLALVGARDELRDDDVVLDRVGELLSEASSVSVLSLRTTLRALTGAKPGPEASVRKLFSAEHDQRVQELGLVLLGPDGAVADGDGATWSYGFLANRCLTIAGGTSEVQRNVIAERLLGLPRDP